MIFYIILYICGIFLTYFWQPVVCFFTYMTRNILFFHRSCQKFAFYTTFYTKYQQKYIIKYNSVQKIHIFIQPVSKKKQNLVHLRHHLKQINYNYAVFLYNLFDNLGQKIQNKIQLDLQKIHNSPKCTYFYTTFLTTADP